MDPRFYGMKLENHKMFKDLKDCFNEKSDVLRNLIELKDDVLYVWNPVENCLFALNLKYLEEHGPDAKYQRLQLVTPPPFAVHRLRVGACGTRLCAWGARGAAVAELPARWGRGGLFDAGRDTVLCKNLLLDERFLYSSGDVRRVHWHPTSLSHVLVLLSDNTIRVYNIALKQGPKLVRVITTGPKPVCQFSGKKMLDSLGDTAVDFTPLPDTESLLALRGNGDVYMIDCDLNSKSQPRELQPLAVCPPADDNYGEESCSIAVVDSHQPALVVIATCTAVLYHCLLLPEPLDETAVEHNQQRNHSLYVVEAVELNISLRSEDGQLPYSYPMLLYPLMNNSGSYACLHAAGAHAVTVPLLALLREYMAAEDADIETIPPSVSSKPSVARYVLCTQYERAASPPAGVAGSPSALATLLVLCPRARLVVRTLEPYDLEEQLYAELRAPGAAPEREDAARALRERQRLSFVAIMKDILARGVSQPLLSLSSTQEPSPKEALEFLTQATMKLRQEYIDRQRRATDAIVKKATGLKTLSRQQKDWFADLSKEIDEALSLTETLRSKCCDAERRQEDMKFRCSAVIRALRAADAASPAERALLAELERHRAAAETHRARIERLKDLADAKHAQIQQRQEEYKKKDIALGKSHSETISSILQQQTAQISTLIEETKLLKDQLSIV